MLTVIACLTGMAATIVCLRASWRMRRTTLAAPCTWAAAALAFVTCAIGLAAIRTSPTWLAHFDYLAGIFTLAPFVSLLGAKRPQDRAWQLIVAALLGLLAFQDFRSWLLDPTVEPSPHTAWRWLITALVVMQALNYLATRHAAAACLVCAGQCLLLQTSLVFLGEVSRGLIPLGTMLVGAAVFAAVYVEMRRPVINDAYQRQWLDFRDRYGVLWGLRVKERVNATAQQQNSRLRLGWRGFRAVEASGQPSQPEQPARDDLIYKAFSSILARFNDVECRRSG
jgi:hypothetical protein